MTTPWRLILDGAADGAWNMAVDETLLESYVGPASPAAPTLRIYGWRPAALSLGSHQKATSAHDPLYLRSRGIDLVRRPTGGAAVLHDRERTYAVVGRLRHAPFVGSVSDTYRRISVALLGALERLGARVEPAAAPHASASRSRTAAVCFEQHSEHEVLFEGRKLTGSAQLRRRSAFLQHGSVPLRLDVDRLYRATGARPGGTRFTDLATALGRMPDPRELDRALVDAFGSAFGTRLEPGDLGRRERLRAVRLRSRKYLSAAWVFDGETSDPGA